MKNRAWPHPARMRSSTHTICVKPSTPCAGWDALGHLLTVQRAWQKQGDTGETVAEAARNSDIDLQIMKWLEAKKAFVLLPWRWVVERNFGWLARFRRLSQDDERLSEVLGRLHFLIFAVRMMLPAAARVLSGNGSSSPAPGRCHPGNPCSQMQPNTFTQPRLRKNVQMVRFYSALASRSVR